MTTSLFQLLREKIHTARNESKLLALDELNIRMSHKDAERLVVILNLVEEFTLNQTTRNPDNRFPRPATPTRPSENPELKLALLVTAFEYGLFKNRHIQYIMNEMREGDAAREYDHIFKSIQPKPQCFPHRENFRESVVRYTIPKP